jgi:DNA-binding NarL/FixJ family response regulator
MPELPQSTIHLARAEVVRLDLDSHESIALREVWEQLIRGERKIRDSFMTDDRCFLVLSDLGFEEAVPLDARRLAIFERALLGEAQKVLASEYQVAISTVAVVLKNCLKFIGLECNASRVPLLVILAASAARKTAPLREARASVIFIDGQRRLAISTPRPDAPLASALPRAQYQVARLRVEGKTLAEIASLRQTSQRTVANQLSAVFGRLRASGRSELMQFLTVSARPSQTTREARSASERPPAFSDDPLGM